jgi:hypothetical protein
LPHLTFFGGPDTVAEAIVDSSLSHISIHWNPQRKAPTSTVYDAISHSGAELLSVYNSISYWDPALLTTIVENAPKVTSLSFDNFGRIYNLGDVEVSPHFDANELLIHTRSPIRRSLLVWMMPSLDSATWYTSAFMS